MGFLDAGCDCAGDMDFDVSGTFSESAAFSEKHDASHANSLRFFDGGEDITRLSARRKPDEDIPRFAESADLTGEDVLEGVVVADGGEESPVGAQGDGGIGAAVALEAAGELSGDMPAVSSAAAVTADEKFTAGFETGENEIGGFSDFGFELAEGLEGLQGAVEGLREFAHEGESAFSADNSGRVSSSPLRAAHPCESMSLKRCR